MQARHAVRAGLVAHAIALGMLILMLGLIHVAPLSATPAHVPSARELGRGFLRINALPWANVSIDGARYGTTPIARPIELAAGSHAVRLEHDWYQPVMRRVEVTEGVATAPKVLSLDFEAERIPLAAGRTPPAAAPGESPTSPGATR